MKAVKMVKETIVIKFILISLTAIALSGCIFIVVDDHKARYYGIDKQRGSELLNLILDKQQQVYQPEKASAEAKKP
ncbi:MAG: hypothetical protein KJ569_04130 [Candidatus Omnitrophica bacterium]|nr:hypothetical protein [Candidatus Omnitrophota bacterium]MBU0897336.1 hypothetical protein [Candidatus Omnitrophota bacterium]MBU1134084.1 hypothetical protein [Candidatus Omnitrophota bacterium]MBU1811176.1 hypothetical protein [Candidatus Omnitrophota bacterium]